MDLISPIERRVLLMYHTAQEVDWIHPSCPSIGLRL